MTNAEGARSIYVSVDSLHFDPDNPRLPSSITRSDEQVVLDWMLKDATIVELMGAIGAKGYFPGEPLLVIRDPRKQGDYIVIEGNRRLTAVKLLRDPYLAPRLKKTVEQASEEAKEKPDDLPVLVFPKREEILDYLGYRHITGVKSWGSLAKTKYLAQLLQTLPEGLSLEEQYRQLAKIIGSRSDYVAKMLTGLAIYDKIVDSNFFNIPSISEDSIDFSVLTTALGYGNVPIFLGIQNNKDRSLSGLKTERLEEFSSWLFEKNSQGKTRLGESRRLGQLNNVLASERALKVFREGVSLKDAELLTEAPDEVFRRAIIEAKSRLETSRDTFHLVTAVSPNDSENLADIFKLARNIRTLVEEKILDAAD